MHCIIVKNPKNKKQIIELDTIHSNHDMQDDLLIRIKPGRIKLTIKLLEELIDSDGKKLNFYYYTEENGFASKTFRISEKISNTIKHKHPKDITSMAQLLHFAVLDSLDTYKIKGLKFQKIENGILRMEVIE